MEKTMGSSLTTWGPGFRGSLFGISKGFLDDFYKGIIWVVL